MGRIRTIKPEFPQSESMGRMSRDARLLFILMWTMADDAGRLRGNARVLCGQLFPFDDDAPQNIESWVDELIAEECIIRYMSGGTQFIQIVAWKQHQKIDKPSKSYLPDPPSSLSLDKTPQQVSDSTNPREPSTNPRESSRALSSDSRTLATDLGPSTMDLGSITAPNESAESDSRKKRFQKPTNQDVAFYAKAEGLHLDAVAFCDFYESKGWRVGREPMKDWRAAARNWARNSFGPRAGPKQSSDEEEQARKLEAYRESQVKVY